MPHEPAHNLSVLKGLEFVEDVRLEAARAKKIAWAQSMDYSPGEITDSFFSIFIKASEKGLHVKINIDYYSLLFVNASFSYLPLFNKEKERLRRDAIISRIQSIDELRRKNIDVQMLNKPTVLERLFPAKGRNHMKMVIVDDIAYMGGINFHEDNFKCDDFMVKISDPVIVRFLKEIFLKNHHHEQLHDITLQSDEKTTMLVDGGKPGSSIILSHAVNLIYSAQENIFLSTAFYPDGELVDAMHDAKKRGVKMTIIVPSFKNVDGIAAAVNRTETFLMTIKGKKIPLLKNKRKMHSKCILVDGKKVLFGSHNFSKRGVQMGTVELAMESTETQLIANIQKYFDYLITGTT